MGILLPIGVITSNNGVDVILHAPINDALTELPGKVYDLIFSLYTNNL